MTRKPRKGPDRLPFRLRRLLPRFHELVDLRLTGKLSPKQQAELRDIESRLDAYEDGSPSDAAWRAWMNQLDREHARVVAQLDEIETRLRRKEATR